MTTNDLFVRFQERLTAVGGESHAVAGMKQAAEVISAHPALADGEVIVAPNFAACQPWGAILPLLTGKGIKIREAGSPARRRPLYKSLRESPFLAAATQVSWCEIASGYRPANM